MESWFKLSFKLELIMNYRSSFVTYGNEIESKGIQFPGRDTPDESANRQSPPITRTFVALHHRNTKIRMRSDVCDKLVTFPIILSPIKNFSQLTLGSTKNRFKLHGIKHLRGLLRSLRTT